MSKVGRSDPQRITLSKFFLLFVLYNDDENEDGEQKRWSVRKCFSLSLSIAREFEWAIVPIILFTVLVGHNSDGLKYNSSTRGNERLAERNVKGNFLWNETFPKQILTAATGAGLSLWTLQHDWRLKTTTATATAAATNNLFTTS